MFAIGTNVASDVMRPELTVTITLLYSCCIGGMNPSVPAGMEGVNQRAASGHRLGRPFFLLVR